MYNVEVGACLVARVVSVVEAAAQEGRDRQDQGPTRCICRTEGTC